MDLLATAAAHEMTCSSFLSMRMWDLPGGQLDPEQLNLSFEDTDAVIFVLDAQSTLHDVIRKLSVTMHKAYTANPGIQFEIFLHKVDGMSEDYRLGASIILLEKSASCALTLLARPSTDTLQNLRDRLTEELFDMSPELESNMNVFYHLTSVFDTSIYEALSKVIQKLIPEQAMLERLLDLLCQVGLHHRRAPRLGLQGKTTDTTRLASPPRSAMLDGQGLFVRNGFQDLHRDRFCTTRQPNLRRLRRLPRPRRRLFAALRVSEFQCLPVKRIRV